MSVTSINYPLFPFSLESISTICANSSSADSSHSSTFDVFDWMVHLPPTEVRQGERLAISASESIALRQDAYTKYPGRWLFRGTQHGCDGYVLLEEVETVRIFLQTKRAAAIFFNSKYTTSYLHGGTCTVMALDFIRAYFALKRERCRSSKRDKTEILTGKIIQLASQFLTSSNTRRTIQAAFNTIEVKKKHADARLDYSRNKIESLASYYNLSVKCASDEINIDTLESEKALRYEMDALPRGVFLVRILKTAENRLLSKLNF